VDALKRPKEAVPAAVALLNRGWGLPTQPVENTGPQDFNLMHLIAAKHVAEKLMQERANSHANSQNHNGAAMVEGDPVVDFSKPALE
jgi:hypothetical protein